MYVARMKTVSDIVDLWPKQADFAADCGVKWMTVYQWRQRNKIPPEYWAALVRAAKRKGFPAITEKLLAEMTAAKKRIDQRTSKKRRAASNEVAA